MASMRGYTQFIGPTETILAGGAWTYNHLQNQKAVCIEALSPDGQPLAKADVLITQPSASQIVATAVTGQPGGITLRVEWSTYSPLLAGPLPGSVGAITPPPGPPP